MLIIPAVDIRDGRCVRLVHGELSQETVYYADPAEAARRWESEGARRLHLVDLDGAFAGAMKNGAVIGRIARALSIPIQAGGGIRDLKTAAKLFELGVSSVIIGTAAVKDQAFVQELCRMYPGCVIAGIDARDGRVATEGWVEEADLSATELAQRMESLGVAEIIYTDIYRDGTLKGPNLAALREMAQASALPVIASGGVSSLADIENLLALEPMGVRGVIVGQAVYTGRIQLREAINLAGGAKGC